MNASAVLDSLKLNRPRRRVVNVSAPWGVQIPSGDGSPGMYLIASGRAVLSVEGESPAVLEAGDVAVFPHGSAHAIASQHAVALRPIDEFCATAAEAGADYVIGGGGGDATELHALCFDVAGDTQRAIQAFAPQLVVMRARDREPWLAHIARAALELAEDPALATDAARLRLGELLVLEALSGRCSTGIRERDPAMLRAAMLLRTELATPWTISRLARRVGVSRSALYDRFVRAVGCAPNAYLVRARMQEAAVLLERGLSVDEVARSVGYAWPASFTTAFRRFHGKRPSAFKRYKSARSRTP